MNIIRFFAPVNNQTVQQLIAGIDLVRVNDDGDKSVHLLLATTGGSTDAGIAAHNFIKASGLNVTAVNMGMVASIGTIIFCAATRRVSMPQARFSFHPNTFNIQHERLGVHQLEEKASQLKVEHDAIAEIISESTGKCVDEARDLILLHRSLSARESQEFGLVHEIQTFQIPPDARVLAIDA